MSRPCLAARDRIVAEGMSRLDRMDDCEHGVYFEFCDECAPCEKHDTHGCCR